MKIKITLLLFLIHFCIWGQNDCPDAIIVCGDMSYKGLNATGIGDIQEIGPNTCSLGSSGDNENNTIWLKVLIKDGGTLGFVLTPESSDLVVDFDFWLFGPDVPCDNLGLSLRCSTTNPGNAQLTYNTTGMNDTETDFSEGPGADGNAFIQWITVEDDEIYYLVIDRPHGSSDFSLEWTGTATFHDVPVFHNPNNIPLDMSQCDDDGVYDHSSQFDLTIYEDMFIDTQTDVEITYHTSLNDVTTGENPIENPEAYFNTSTPQTIYLRMTNTITACYDIESFVIEIPVVAGQAQNLELCDTGGDGIEEFDLALNDGPVSLDDPDATVTYYTSQENAENETAPIGPLYSNQAPFISETLWVRLEKSGEICFDLAPFDITVFATPVFNNPQNIPLDINLCDPDNTLPDTFDLTVNEPMFTGSQANIAFSYYEDEESMLADLPIDMPQTYLPTSNPQTIYAKVRNLLKPDCFSTINFEIEIPVEAGTPLNLSLCDDDENGKMEFDLTENDDAIKNGNTNATVIYYASEADAEGENNPIGPLYENTTPYVSQTIWARMEIIGKECYDLVTFTINITPLPVINTPGNTVPDIRLCDEDDINDGSTAFNLTINESAITGTQENITFKYYKDAGDLATDTPISNPGAFANTSNPQTIYMKMSSGLTNCSIVRSFNISTSIVVAGIAEDLPYCDEDQNGIQTFDLTINDNFISNGDTNLAVTYYISLENAQNEINPLGDTYQNQTPYNLETIWARVEQINGDCYDITSFVISIVPLPQFNNPQNIDTALSQCDADAVDDQSTLFDLTVNEAMYTGNQSNIVFVYYESLADMNAGTNPIQTPEAYANTTNPQTIFVQMMNTVSFCSSPSIFELEIINPVLAGPATDLWLCDTNGNGIQVFNLGVNDFAIANGVPNRKVEYYLTVQDAENETNPLTDIYQNAMPYMQTIWARIESTAGCFGHAITSFKIGVNPLAEIDYTVKVEDFTTSNNSISIQINHQEVFEFSIDGITYTDIPFFDNLVPGVYTIYIRSKDGCSKTKEDIVVLNYPKFFTPNGDNENETWQVYFLYYLPKSKVSIFDRYGKLISSFWGDSMGWDGNYNGHPLPSTDYWFLLELESGRVVKGHFSMVR